MHRARCEAAVPRAKLSTLCTQFRAARRYQKESVTITLLLITLVLFLFSRLSFRIFSFLIVFFFALLFAFSPSDSSPYFLADLQTDSRYGIPSLSVDLNGAFHVWRSSQWLLLFNEGLWSRHSGHFVRALSSSTTEYFESR